MHEQTYSELPLFNEQAQLDAEYFAECATQLVRAAYVVARQDDSIRPTQHEKLSGRTRPLILYGQSKRLTAAIGHNRPQGVARSSRGKCTCQCGKAGDALRILFHRKSKYEIHTDRRRNVHT